MSSKSNKKLALSAMAVAAAICGANFDTVYAAPEVFPDAGSMHSGVNQ